MCFANAVTKHSPSRLDFVARSGPLSLFSALGDFFPPSVRLENGSGFRDGVTEIQFNKELQKNGFSRVRDRRTHATKRSEDPTGAGMYLFSQLKWRDPTDPEDREVLLEKWQNLVKKNPLMTMRCSLEKFLALVQRFQTEWETSIERLQAGSFLEAEDAETDASESLNDDKSPFLFQPSHCADMTAKNVFVADSQSLVSSTLFQSAQLPSNTAFQLNQEIAKMSMSKALLQQQQQQQPLAPVLCVPAFHATSLQNQLAAALLSQSLQNFQVSQTNIALDQIELQKALLSISPVYANQQAISALALQQVAMQAQEALKALSPLTSFGMVNHHHHQAMPLGLS